MKFRYVIALVVFVMLITFFSFFSFDKEVEVRATINNIDEDNAIKVKSIVENDEKYDIQVYYPETKNDKLNEIITERILEYVDNFKKENENNFKQSILTIKYDTYEYGDYISFLFTNVIDTGGAHPNTFLSSIVYNLKREEEIDISYLVNKNKDFLNFLSDFSYNKLKENENIVQSNTMNMLKEGTTGNKVNFKTFVFSEEGAKFFFERYQVAPYYLGEFSVTLPYEKFLK